MPNYYEISATDATLVLRDGKGSAGFTVRYVGGRAVEAWARAVPLDDAQESWLQLAPPEQRDMQPGQTHTFKVTVTVPPGTPAGRYGLRLDVMSADNTDEEYDQGPMVAFEVAESAPPQPKGSGFPWWVVVTVALVLMVGGGGLAWWLNADNGAERVPPADVEPVEPAEEDIPADKTGRFAVSQTWHGDLDLGREVPRGASRSEADFWFQARTATDRSVVPKNGAQLRLMRHSGQQAPTLVQIKQALVGGGNTAEIDVRRLRPGRWVAVRTSAGGHAAFTVTQPVGASPAELRLQYHYWRAKRSSRPVVGRAVRVLRLDDTGGNEP
ncbi:MAG: hypothetical protein J5I81_14370 [Nitrococcus mobilis]|nr:hypothetical protein [Nitrococcus mobilis]